MLDALREQLAREKRIDLVIRARPGAPRSRFVSTLADGSLKIVGGRYNLESGKVEFFKPGD